MILTKISKKCALESEHKDYNAYEWSKKVEMYAEYPECQFYESREKKEYGKFPIYAIYVADGIRFMQEVKYSSALSSSGLIEGRRIEMKDGRVQIERITPKGYSVKKDNETREILKRITKYSVDTVFY